MTISPPDTRASLILRLRDAGDELAWEEFTSIYAPAIYQAARRLRLQEADAEDCVQEVLAAVAKSVAQWLRRQNRGPFRHWLFRIARNTAIDYLTLRKHRMWPADEQSADNLDQVAFQSHVSKEFDLEYRRAIFMRASETVQSKVTPTTWQAFFRTAVLELSVQDVATELGMSPGSVYIARSRVMKRLQDEVQLYEDSSNDEL